MRGTPCKPCCALRQRPAARRPRIPSAQRPAPRTPIAGSLFNKYPFDLPTETFTFERFQSAFAAVQASLVHLQVGWGAAGVVRWDSQAPCGAPVRHQVPAQPMPLVLCTWAASPGSASRPGAQWPAHTIHPVPLPWPAHPCTTHPQGVPIAKRFALVPLGPPLLAYSSTSKSMLVYDEEQRAVVLRTAGPVEAGQPVTAWCGPQPNSRLLLNYGLVDEHNPFDKLQVGAGCGAGGAVAHTETGTGRCQDNSMAGRQAVGGCGLW